MLSPEKNDVDISKLFNWNKEITIYGVDGIVEMKAFVRLVGDADWNIARVKALRASAELRNKLGDETSDEHLAYIPDLKQLNKEKLVTMIVLLDMPNIRDIIIDEISVTFPKEPSSDASLKDQEKYQKELDDFENKRFEVIKEKIEKRVEESKKKLRKETNKDLYDTYMNLLIDSLCKEELNKVFIEYCVYFGTYKDKSFTTRFFETFEEFTNLPRQIKGQFVSAYTDMDIGVYELKK